MNLLRLLKANNLNSDGINDILLQKKLVNDLRSNQTELAGIVKI